MQKCPVPLAKSKVSVTWLGSFQTTSTWGVWVFLIWRPTNWNPSNTQLCMSHVPSGIWMSNHTHFSHVCCGTWKKVLQKFKWNLIFAEAEPPRLKKSWSQNGKKITVFSGWKQEKRMKTTYSLFWTSGPSTSEESIIFSETYLLPSLLSPHHRQSISQNHQIGEKS